MPPEKESLGPPLSFRCPASISAKFLSNVEARGWRKDDVLRKLVESCNALFSVTGGKPEWPLAVVDDDTVVIYTDPQTKAEMVRKATAASVAAKLKRPATSQPLVDFLEHGKKAKSVDQHAAPPASGAAPTTPRRLQGSPRK